MIFCFHMFWKSKYPKFYAPVVEKMKEANNKAFLRRKDIDLKSASNLNGNLNCSKELEHYAS